MSADSPSWPDPEELCLLIESGKRKHLDQWMAKWGGADRVDQAIATMWSSSTNGEALLVLANHSVDRKAVTLAACACARLVLALIPDDESRPARALATAEAWCEGNASIEAVRAAASASFEAERGFYAASPTAATAAACDAASFAALSALGAQARVHADDSIEHRTGDNVAQAIRVAASRHALLALTRDDPRLADVAFASSDPRAIAAVSAAREKAHTDCAARVRKFVEPPRFSALIAVSDPRRPAR